MPDNQPLGKYLFAERLDSPGKTERWAIHSARHGDVLGQVRWFGRWRQYVFHPVEGTVFNSDCLADIELFLRDRMIRWRDARKAAANAT